MAEVQDRHRKAAEAFAGPNGPRHSIKPGGWHWRGLVEGYAQALADVEDLNGYDLTACRAAYAHVCEAVTPGAGPGGAAAVAMSVQLLRRRAERAEAQRDRLRKALAESLRLVDEVVDPPAEVTKSWRALLADTGARGSE